MARAVFYAEIGGKTRKRTLVIDDKLAVLNDVVDTLGENDIFNDDDIGIREQAILTIITCNIKKKRQYSNPYDETFNLWGF